MQVEEIASPHVIGQTPRIDNVNGRKSPRSQLSVVLRFSQIRSTKRDGSNSIHPYSSPRFWIMRRSSNNLPLLLDARSDILECSR